VFLQTMIALASAALGLVAALAWNEAIRETIRLVLGEGGRPGRPLRLRRGGDGDRRRGPGGAGAGGGAGRGRGGHRREGEG
jgi:hypothetical protein